MRFDKREHPEKVTDYFEGMDLICIFGTLLQTKTFYTFCLLKRDSKGHEGLPAFDAVEKYLAYYGRLSGIVSRAIKIS